MGIKLKVIQIGNSQGIRLPKQLLAQCGIKKEVEVEAEEGVITLRPVRKAVRTGWDKAFSEMAQRGDDQLLMDVESISSAFDESDWEWK